MVFLLNPYDWYNLECFQYKKDNSNCKKDLFYCCYVVENTVNKHWQYSTLELMPPIPSLINHVVKTIQLYHYFLIRESVNEKTKVK